MHISKINIEDLDPANTVDIKKGDLVWTASGVDGEFEPHIVERKLFDGQRVDIVSTKNGQIKTVRPSWLFKFKRRKND